MANVILQFALRPNTPLVWVAPLTGELVIMGKGRIDEINLMLETPNDHSQMGVAKIMRQEDGGIGFENKPDELIRVAYGLRNDEGYFVIGDMMLWEMCHYQGAFN